MRENLRIVALIPARYGATRFPGKMLAPLAGKPVIVRTCEAALRTGLFSQVYVVTDDKRVFEAVVENGFHCLMSKREHPTGSDRIAEAVAEIECDIAVNIQGDEPFINREALEKLIAVFYEKGGEQIDVSTLVQELTDPALIKDPNYVKVVFDNNHFALYFSRSVIPFCRDGGSGRYFEHIGAYAFRKEALLDFSRMPMLQNEEMEKVECIRFLEYGKKIKVIETGYIGMEIDTPEDLINAEKLYKQRYGNEI